MREGTEKPQSLKETVQKDWSALETARDELKLKVHLAKADVKSEWEKLERTYERVQEQLQMTLNGTEQPVKDVGTALKTLFDELSSGYARIREGLKSPPHN